MLSYKRRQVPTRDYALNHNLDLKVARLILCHRIWSRYVTYRTKQYCLHQSGVGNSITYDYMALYNMPKYNGIYRDSMLPYTGTPNKKNAFMAGTGLHQERLYLYFQ